MAPQTPATTAMLFALTSRHPSIPLDEFNRWYDERHAPSRAACPGVRSVSRFHLVGEAQSTQRKGDWTWLAMYELESEDALKSEEYRKARREDGDDESKMFDFLSRRVYKLLDDKRRDDYATLVSSGKCRLLSMTGLKPQGSARHSSAAIVEQTANLAGLDGWVRSSYWQLSTAADPRTWEEQTDVPTTLVLHEWEDSDVARSNGAAAYSEPAPEHIATLVAEKALLELWKLF